MRLSDEQASAIVSAIRAVAGNAAQVRLFGSRLDDDKRGGDIDLLVEVPAAVDRPAWLAALIAAAVQRRLGDRKVDVLLVDPCTKLQPVHLFARHSGRLLT